MERLPENGWTDEDLQALVNLSCHATSFSVELWAIVVRNSFGTKPSIFLQQELVNAAKNGNTHAVSFLLERATSLKTNMGTKTILEAFEAACRRGHSSVVSCLLQTFKKELTASLVYKSLKLSAANGSTDVVVLLVDYLVFIKESIELTQPFMNAARNGKLGAVKALLTFSASWKGFEVDIERALSVACFNGHRDIVDELLAAGANIGALVFDVKEDRRGFWISNGDEDQESSENKVDILPGPGTTSLQSALAGLEGLRAPRGLKRHQSPESDREEVIKLLLDHGADVHNPLPGKGQPIIIASSHCSKKVVNWLIEAGADVNVMTELDHTKCAAGYRQLTVSNAVLAAAGRECSAAAVFRRLLQAGAVIQSDMYSVDDLFSRCLWYFKGDGRFKSTDTLQHAMTDGPGAVVKILLEALPFVKAEHEDFRGFLQSAAMLNDGDLVELLLERGIDINFAGSTYGTALQAASRFGRVEVVQRLLEKQADPNILQGRHQTALRAAVDGGHARVVELLLQHGADVNLSFIEDPEAFSQMPSVPLMNLAAKSGNAEIVSMLISAGVDVLADPPNHLHPLILACESGDLETIRCLIASGAPVGVLGKRRKTLGNLWEKEASPLHMACYHGRGDILQLLLGGPVDVNIQVENSGTPLHLAAKYGHSALIRILLDAGADVDRLSSDEHTALSIAVGRGHKAVVQDLLASEAIVYDPQRKHNPLIIACFRRSSRILELLLEATAGIHSWKDAIIEAFDTAATEQRIEALEVLIEYVSQDIETFHKACIGGSSSLANALLDGGVPVNAADRNGTRALDLAAHHLHLDVVKLLVKRGADINHGLSSFGSPLSAAVYACVSSLPPQATPTLLKSPPKEPHDPRQDTYFLRRFDFDTYSVSSDWDMRKLSKCEKIVQFLIEHGATTEPYAREFGHALHLASFLGSTTIIRNLLSAGANIHTEAGYFGIPLFAAIHQGHLEAVHMLMQEGSRVNYDHPILGTPLFFACKHNHGRVIQAMLEFGGDPNILGPDGNTALSTVLKSESFTRFSSDKGACSAVIRAFLKCPNRLSVRSCDLVSAAASQLYDYSPVADLLEYDKDVIVPEDAVVASLTNNSPSEKDLLLLLARTGGLGVTEPMLLKARKQEMLILLDHEPCVSPTETAVFRVLEPDSPRGRRDKKITEILEKLWARNPVLTVTEAMLQIMHLHSSTVEWLLSHAPKDLKITQAMLFSTQPPFCATPQVVRIFLRRDPNLKLTEEMITGMLGRDHSSKMLDVFLEHEPNMLISEPIFLAAFGETTKLTETKGKELVEVLQKHNKRLRYTGAMRRAVEEILQSYPSERMMRTIGRMMSSDETLQRETKEKLRKERRELRDLFYGLDETAH